jgi:ArsR family transcriptional regulator, arsenate/arsenite/antimonite-responsive transcriptional repressor
MVLHICDFPHTLKLLFTDVLLNMTPDTFYKALADDTRLRCLLLITQYQELCVCELTEALNETQPKISRHLAQLRKNGILSDRRQGQWVFYQLHPELANWSKSVLQTTLDNQVLWLKDNVDQLETMGGRPQRTGSCC